MRRPSDCSVSFDGTFAIALVARLVIGCATLANDSDAPNADVPNAHVGPFRALTSSELGATGVPAPYLLRNSKRHYRSPSVVRRDSGTRAAALYVLGDTIDGPRVFRFKAEDALHFGPLPDPADPVLGPSENWEGGIITDAHAVSVGSEIVLFYAAMGGIGRATSGDGVHFAADLTPVLAADQESAWEAGRVPSTPALMVLAKDDYRLFYSANGRMGEAHSLDGVHFSRAQNDAVLEPSALDDAFDNASVSHPEPWIASTAEGRQVTRLYYTGTDRAGRAAVGLSARYGTQGEFVRAYDPVFTGPRNPRSPAVLPFAGFTLLYVEEEAGPSPALAYAAIAASIAPATLSISQR